MMLSWNLILPALGLAFILFGLWGKKYLKKTEDLCSAVVTAEIVDIKVTPGDGETNPSYSPVYRYVFNGVEYTVRLSGVPAGTKLEIGEKCEIFCNPGNPSQAVSIKGGSGIAASIFVAVGLLMLLVFAVSFIR